MVHGGVGGILRPRHLDSVNTGQQPTTAATAAGATELSADTADLSTDLSTVTSGLSAAEGE